MESVVEPVLHGLRTGLSLTSSVEFAIWCPYVTSFISAPDRSGFEEINPGRKIMPSVLDRVIEKELRRELKDALIRFEKQLRQGGVTEENVRNRMRGAKQFVAFLYGRYLG